MQIHLPHRFRSFWMNLFIEKRSKNIACRIWRRADMGWKYFRMVNLFERSNENKLWIKNKVKEKRKEEIIMTERMKEIVAEALNVEIETLKEDTSFKEDLGADSLDLFELVMAFEEEFGVEILSEDLEKITTIKDAAAYMEAHKE